MISTLSLPLQVRGRDAEGALAELALDDEQPGALARELGCVGVPKLVGARLPPEASMHDSSSQVRSGRGSRPGGVAGRTVDNAEQRPNGHPLAQLERSPNRLIAAPSWSTGSCRVRGA